MASGVYNQFKADVLNGEVDLEADTIMVALLDSNHTFTATDTTWADISANEVGASGTYVAGGTALVGSSVTEAASTKWDATDHSWTTATITARYAVLYNSSVSDNLILCIDFGSNKTSTAGTFTIQWASAGILTLT